MARHIPRVYCEQALSGQAAVTLTDSTAHHLLRVLRIKPGASLILFDGRGGEYAAQVLRCDKQQLTAEITAFDNSQRESHLRLRLLQAVARGEHMDYSIAKAVELGVSHIQPLMLQHSQGMDSKRLLKKQRHWQGIVQSAAEQCGRTILPALGEVCDLQTGLDLAKNDDLKFVLHPGETITLDAQVRPQSLTVLIGPEGGLSDEEVTIAVKAGFKTLSLGPRILRTETAALTALSIVQARWGDLLTS